MKDDDDNAKDPYLKQSRSRQVQPKKINDIGNLFFIYALPNEYILPIGVDGAKPVLGGRFFRVGRKFLKVPASVETVYFTSDNANRNYQGLRIDGYAVWRVDPQRPEVAMRSLDFFDQIQPMDNTNRILQTICTEAIRHIIANITIDDALRKKNEIADQLKNQLTHVQNSWGIVFDQVGIERITILSSEVFDDLQQKNRDELRFAAANSKMETDQLIEQKKAEYSREIEKTHTQSERESRILKSTSETEIRTIELKQQAQREAEQLKFEEQKLIRDKAADKAKLKAETDDRIFLAEEQQRQLNAEINAQTNAEIANAKEKLRLAIAKTESEIAEFEQTQQSLLVKQQLEEQLLVDKQTLKLKRLAEKQQGKLKLKAEKQQVLLELLRQKEKLDYEIRLQAVECEKLEAELKNNISAARIQADFVRQLPKIAAAIKIDNYSAFDSTGASPLTSTIAQVWHIFENSGAGQLFSGSRTEKPAEHE